MSAVPALVSNEDATANVVIPFSRHVAQPCPTFAQRPAELEPADMDRLNRLRWLALKSRLAPKPDVERACYLLAGDTKRAM